MKDKLLVNWRVEFGVDIYSILEEIQKKYEIELELTAEHFDTYDEVSNETYNDLLVVKARLETLMIVGYLDKDEFNALTEYAESLRYDLLYRLENKKEGEEDGSEEEF